MADKVKAELKSLRWQSFIFLFIAGCINAFVTISDVADMFKAND